MSFCPLLSFYHKFVGKFGRYMGYYIEGISLAHNLNNSLRLLLTTARKINIMFNLTGGHKNVISKKITGFHSYIIQRSV